MRIRIGFGFSAAFARDAIPRLIAPPAAAVTLMKLLRVVVVMRLASMVGAADKGNLMIRIDRVGLRRSIAQCALSIVLSPLFSSRFCSSVAAAPIGGSQLPLQPALPGLLSSYPIHPPAPFI